MLKKQLLLIVVIFFLSASLATAAGLKVAEGVITTAIVNQRPVDKVESYRADYGKLFCFTRIVGAQEDTEVTHVWYFQDNELARVTLPVKSSDWRTYSSKRFLPQWVGEWKVVILDSQQNELATIPFRLE